METINPAICRLAYCEKIIAGLLAHVRARLLPDCLSPEKEEPKRIIAGLRDWVYCRNT
jgi:hypothetical protein